MTYTERIKIVDDYAKAIKKKYPQINRYNILIFGSFLTERYSENSDIDIGVFSLESGLTFRLYNFTKDYFEQLEINSDVIRMHLSDSQYINISIILSQQYAVTDYCSGTATGGSIMTTFSDALKNAGILPAEPVGYNKETAGSLTLEMKLYENYKGNMEKVLENVQNYCAEYEKIRIILWQYSEHKGILNSN